MAPYYSTGLPDLDDALGGGLPAGSVAVLETPPASAGVLLAAAFAAVPTRPTVYLTTDRTPGQIETDVLAAREAHNPSLTGTDDQPLSHLVVSKFDEAVLSTEIQDHAEPAGTGDTSPDDEDGAGAAASTSDDTEPAGDEQLPTIPESVTAITRGAADQFTDAVDDGGDEAPFALVFDALTPLLDAPEETWTTTYRLLRESIDDLDGVALLVLPRAPGRSLSTAERRLLHRADAVFRYVTTDRARPDALVASRVSGAASDCDDLPLDVPLNIRAAVEKNPDETFS